MSIQVLKMVKKPEYLSADKYYQQFLNNARPLMTIEVKSSDGSWPEYNKEAVKILKWLVENVNFGYTVGFTTFQHTFKDYIALLNYLQIPIKPPVFSEFANSFDFDIRTEAEEATAYALNYLKEHYPDRGNFIITRIESKGIIKKGLTGFNFFLRNDQLHLSFSPLINTNWD